MTVTIGWWIVPTVFTIAWLVRSLLPRKEMTPSYESVFAGFGEAVNEACYLFWVLVSWVVYLAIHAIWGVV